MRRSQKVVLLFGILTAVLLLVLTATATHVSAPEAYLPLISKPDLRYEVRAVWVTRFEWANTSTTPATISEIVDDIAYAGFNTIYFQVRGEADAYYQPGLEPWGRRLTGNLGQDPGWDPLADMIQKAHAKGLQVHAYINTYPVWGGCSPPPTGTNPQHLYYKLLDVHGQYNGVPRALQWRDSDADPLSCADGYMRASPASIEVDEHMLQAADYILNHYDVDGLHLDHTRYTNSGSCDPVSLCRYNGQGANCDHTQYTCNLNSLDYQNWMRAQVNGTVAKFYDLVAGKDRKLWLSAAVWPVYSSGRNTYFQDSKAWLASGDIDSISPMIYSWAGSFSNSDWKALVAEFQAANAGRYVIPGIGGLAFENFAEIEDRIEYARSLGTAGHAIFAYSYLKDYPGIGEGEPGYFDDLRNGPYASPAIPPPINWHP
ncbi:MAG: family 10 glycosylhydrolase [Candidatus Promineifilaceae bacterium]|nr:family 10 glycosylhydrolase [Candidatus Promineifilaceae bacterium]